MRVRHISLAFVQSLILILSTGYSQAMENQVIFVAPEQSNEPIVDDSTRIELLNRKAAYEERFKQAIKGLDGDWEFMSEQSDGSWLRATRYVLLLNIDTSTGKPEVTIVKKRIRGSLSEYNFVFSLQHFQEFGKDVEKLIIDSDWTVNPRWSLPFTRSSYSSFQVILKRDTLILGDTEIDGFIGNLSGHRYWKNVSPSSLIFGHQRVALVRSNDISGINIGKKEVFLLSEK